MQSNSMLQKRAVSTRTITTTAVLTAIIFIMTFLPRIPIPLGYAHLGDAVIFMTVLFAGRRESAVAASAGSALSDLIGGFPIWIVPTLIIKWIMVESVFAVIRPERGTWRILSLRTIAAFLLSAVWMVFSYTVAGGILYGSMAGSTAMIPGLIGEGVINIAVALAAGAALQKFNFHKI
jgi:uncharacterized membrane protein